MSEIKLAKCPFCDAELKRWDYMPNVFFEHPYNGCILSGKKVLESEHDVKAWNTRKPMERIEKKIGDLMPFLTAQEVYVSKNEVLEIVEEEGGIDV